jgi:uncharacterized protein YndB with AHSA1/START domain
VPTSTVEVDRRLEEVFTYVTDPARFAEWQNGVVDTPKAEHLRGEWLPRVKAAA